MITESYRGPKFTSKRRKLESPDGLLYILSLQEKNNLSVITGFGFPFSLINLKRHEKSLIDKIFFIDEGNSLAADHYNSRSVGSEREYNPSTLVHWLFNEGMEIPCPYCRIINLIQKVRTT